MKTLATITLTLFCLNHAALGQNSIGYFKVSKLQEIIILYLDGKYEKLDNLLHQEGYHKSYVFPKPETVSINESFTYTNDTLCSKTDIRVELDRKVKVSLADDEYCISVVYYSSFLHENEEERLKEFLFKYAYNVVESKVTESLNQYIDTNTPESIKRSGNLYLWKVRFYILDGTKMSSNFCGLQFRIKYDIYFRKGYASFDTIGYVSTKEGSGLRLRDKASLSSKIIALIPDKSEITILEYADKVDVIEGQSGNWCKIRFGEKTGWLWGNFISTEKKN